jgi:hypothetical protein
MPLLRLTYNFPPVPTSCSLGGGGLLGSGRSGDVYPAFGSGRAFSDEGEWRVML